MLYQTHILGAVCASMQLNELLLSNELLILEQSQVGGFLGTVTTGVAVFGALIPDLDNPKSYLGNRFKIISVPLNWFAGHRYLFHFWQFYAISFILLLGYSKNIESTMTLAFYMMFIKMLFLGIFSHLLLDLFTTGGIPLRWKHLKRSKRGKKDYHRGEKVSLANINTGSKGEKIFRAIMFLYIVVKLFG